MSPPQSSANAPLQAFVQVEISPDGLEATLFPLRQAPLCDLVASLRQLLRDHKISFGIVNERIDEFATRWQKDEVQEPWVVATGQPAVNAEPRQCRRVHPPVRSGVDPVELLSLFVREGETVFSIEEPTEGRAGTTVTGELLEPGFGSAADFSAGPGLVIDGDLWKAGRTGFLLSREGEITVSKTLTHGRSLPVGEYLWDGDAEIQGDLPDGTRLSLGGSLVLSGSVGEDVEIQSGGDVLIHGAVGSRRTTKISAQGSIRARNVASCLLTAGKDVEVSGGFWRSTCRTHGTFKTTDSGVFVGGKVEAVQGAVLHDVGDPSGTDTQVLVGSSNWVNEAIRELELEVNHWNRHYCVLYDRLQLKFLGALRDRRKLQKLSQSDRKRFMSAERELAKEEKRVQGMIARLRARQKVLDQASTSDDRAVIRIEGRAHRNCKFSVRERVYEVSEEGIARVTLRLPKEVRRVIAVPNMIYDASMEEIGEDV